MNKSQFFAYLAGLLHLKGSNLLDGHKCFSTRQSIVQIMGLFLQTDYQQTV